MFTRFDPIPTADARSIDTLMEGYYELPDSTETGPACGSCSQTARRELGRNFQVRHATVAHVRYCFDTNAAAEAEVRAEAEAERHVEMFFEGAFRPPSGEDIEEDARERFYLSLQGR